VGIFNFFKKKKKEFEERVVITSNVNEELLKVSKEYEIPLSSLDFDLLNTKTYLSIKGDLIEIDNESKSLLEDKDVLLNPENEIKQIYEIKIKKYKLNDKFELLGKVKINPLYTKASFIISPNSILKDISEIKLYNELNKKKLRNSLLIYVFDKKMQDDIKEFFKLFLKSDKKPFEIELCEGIEPVSSKEGKVLLLYKKRQNSVKKELIYPVKENEILIKIIKPKEGKNGRNCRGEIIYVKKPDKFSIPEIEFDEKTIKKIEDEEKIEFIARKDGFLIKEDGKFIIKDELYVKQINLKTGDVKDGNNTDVKMFIKEGDVLKEAIADNMTVEAKELTVKGNVGNKAKIRSINLKIEGQTHKNSVIEAKKADIFKHKGFLKTQEGKVEFLEGGIIEAKKVYIKNAVGGEILAQEIYIENLFSHLKIYALKEIKIKNILGEENLLSISPAKIIKDVSIDNLKQKLIQKEQNISLLKRELEKNLKIWERNKDAYNDLKNLYISNKKKNKKTSSSVLVKLKEYQILQNKITSLKEKLFLIEKEKKELLELIENLQSAVFNAKIISFSPWKAYNRIEFDLLEPPVSLRYDTKGNEGICGFKIKMENETLKIVKIKVENDSST